MADPPGALASVDVPAHAAVTRKEETSAIAPQRCRRELSRTTCPRADPRSEASLMFATQSLQSDRTAMASQTQADGPQSSRTGYARRSNRLDSVSVDSTKNTSALTGAGMTSTCPKCLERPQMSHTPESICVVVYEHARDPEPHGLLTGDTLFIGDVGRPDLLASTGVTAEELARQLHASLHDKLLTLPEATRVFPAHGAGSACGKNLSTETTSTIGEQRRTNYALQPLSVDAFVAAITEGQSTAPAYFAQDATLNKTAHRLLDTEAPGRLDLDDVDRPVVVYCAGGYRSSIAASTLRSRGAVDVSDLLSGYDAWTALTAPPHPHP